MSDKSEVLRQSGWLEVPVDMFPWEVTISEAGLEFNQTLTDRLHAHRHYLFDPYVRGRDLLLVDRFLEGKLVASQGQDESLLCIMFPELIQKARLCSGRYLVQLITSYGVSDGVKGYIIEGCVAAEEEQDNEG